jgi:surface antigen
LGGLLVVAFPPAGIVLGGGALLAGAAAGAVFGAMVTALLGSQEHNHKLDAFQRALASGQILLMVDVPRKREDGVKATILKHHPEAEIGSIRRSTNA